VASLALLALPPRLPRVHDLGAGDRADVHSLAERLVDLETRWTLLVKSLRQRLYPVARVGAHIDGLPDDVVGCAAMFTDTERTFHRHSSLRTVKGGWHLQEK